MSNSFIPLSIPVLNGNELQYVTDCLKSQWVSSAGPWVKRFEDEFSKKLGVAGACSTVSGTAALHLALLLSKVGSGDGVIAPTLTFVAPINVIRYLDAHPFFMDSDEHLNLDPNKLKRFCEVDCSFDGNVLRHKKTNCPIKAVIVVHIFGHPAKIDPILNVAKKFNLNVIEDATESLGSVYQKPSGTRCGTRGDFGCFSFNGNKIITAGGGGMLVAKNPKDLEHAKYLSTQAKDDDIFYVHEEIGYNYRLSSLQAALGIAQLEQLDTFIETKRKNFDRYASLVEKNGLGNMIQEPQDTFSNYWLYSFVMNESFSKKHSLKTIIKKFTDAGIQARPLWKLNHLQTPFKAFEHFEIENATRLYERTLNLPSSVNLTSSDIERVVDTLDKILKSEA